MGIAFMHNHSYNEAPIQENELFRLKKEKYQQLCGQMGINSYIKYEPAIGGGPNSGIRCDRSMYG